MDKQTAIDLLDNLIGMVEDNHDSDYDAALHMGIDALKTQDMSGNMSGTQKALKCTETHECVYQHTETHDLVSRRSAIDSVCEICENCEYFYNEKLIQTIKDLPSAQPEQSIAEWQKDFREYINMLNIPRDDYKGIMEYINEVPSAQPEQIARDIATIIENEQDMRVILKNADCTETHDWILCSERMPEEHEWMGTKRFGTTISDEVYVTFENPKGERFCKHLSFQNGKLSGFDQSTIDAIYKGSKPIAWMPLPKPYAERKEDASSR